MNNLIEISNLNYIIGDKSILNNINLSISSGDFLSILGSNGVGKTTLIKCISNLLDHTSGEIKIENKSTNSYSRKELAKKLAYIPQSINIDCNFTVEDIVLMGRLPYSKIFDEYSKEDYLICERAMRNLDVYHLKDRNILTLSGGERQRAFIARALAQQSQILILDEPISELDIGNQISAMNILKKLNEEKNITIICVLHDLNIALNFSKTSIIMKNGTIMNYGITSKIITPDNIYKIYGVDYNTSSKIIRYVN